MLRGIMPRGKAWYDILLLLSAVLGVFRSAPDLRIRPDHSQPSATG